MKFVKLTNEKDNAWIAIDKIAVIYSSMGQEKGKINSTIVLIDDNTHGIDVCETGDEILKLIQDAVRKD
ncbi:MAG TPA: hypothetical protein PKG56_01220 [Chitinophagaceae bacterium]|nr:hypothetical protein [Chitinophagaceae bacterium]MCC6635057.1 hypothetical protein [Chitinophagaceae bacterium]HNL81986.1 hypothetical protein [Chitinophagaceae bacterium]HNM35083.1 hypothetical protein [Chitinophagaceae bacterium]